MAYKLPSLDALKYFEATARHLSFTLAAEELFLSQSAVSQKIRLLEDQLGYPLFYRMTRRLVLTRKGGNLLPVVRRALNEIETTLINLDSETKSQHIKIHATPSLTSNWLLPRLSDFNEKTSEIDIELDVSVQTNPLVEGENQISLIHSIDGHLPEKSQLLFPDYIYPVATRECIQEFNIYNISALKNAPLLHDSMTGGQLYTSWDNWFSKRKLKNLNTSKSLQFNHASLILSAAAEGNGVGLVRHVVAAPLIKEGKIVPLFNDVEQDGGIYLSYSASDYKSTEVQLFCRWVIKQAKVYEREYAFKNLKIFEAYDRIKPIEMAN